MIQSDNILEGKNCFISGATGGLGKFIASELILNQCNLFLTSTNKTKLKKSKRIESDEEDGEEDAENGTYSRLAPTIPASWSAIPHTSSPRTMNRSPVSSLIAST